MKKKECGLVQWPNFEAKEGFKVVKIVPQICPLGAGEDTLKINASSPFGAWKAIQQMKFLNQKNFEHFESERKSFSIYTLGRKFIQLVYAYSIHV